jgi:prephenate dehydrogenase
MKSLDEAEFTIAGTGLMGSSLALSLRGKVKALWGVDTDPAARTAAAPYFDRIGADLTEAATGADVIILATPVRAILRILDNLNLHTSAPILKPGALIIDLGSVKAPIVAAMDKLPETVSAVGGHPMCGKEFSGPLAADAKLYERCNFVLCSTRRSTPDALDFARQMINTLGARPLLLDAAQHDRAVAAISHMPYLLSGMLVGAVEHLAEGDGTAWELAASGFRDTSRLAASDVTMMGDTVLSNREAVLAALDVFQEQLSFFRDLLIDADEDQLRATLKSARLARLDWFKKYNGDNTKDRV